MYVVADTFTVLYPTSYHTSPRPNFTYDIWNAKYEQYNADLHVSPEGDDNNSGLTADNPKKTISKAVSVILADSLNPRTIHLQDGIYSDSSNGEILPVPMIDYLHLVGESRENVIIEGEGSSPFGISLEDVTGTYVSGLTIRNAWGVWCHQSTLFMEDVNLIDNNGLIGGGIFIEENSDVGLKNMTISGNTSLEGGGVYIDESDVWMEYVEISENRSSWYGGGVDCFASDPVFRNMIFRDNWSGDSSNGNGCSSWFRSYFSVVYGECELICSIVIS